MAGSRNIYVVDDEDAIRRSLGLLLRLAGYEVKSFASGDRFLAEAGALPPGCVLLDVRMPGMTGLEVQQELAARNIALPVVLMTGHGDIAVAAAALGAGAADFIEKPFEQTTLTTALDRVWMELEDPAAFAALARAARDALGKLSETERRILDAFASGSANRAIAHAMDLPLATVEICRATIVEKLGGTSLVDAIRVAFLASRSERDR